MINAGSMGSGKTLQALEWPTRSPSSRKRVLIIAPRALGEVQVKTAHKSHPMRDPRHRKYPKLHDRRALARRTTTSRSELRRLRAERRRADRAADLRKEAHMLGGYATQ